MFKWLKNKLTKSMTNEMVGCMNQTINFCDNYLNGEFDITEVFKEPNIQLRMLINQINSEAKAIKMDINDDWSEITFEDKELVLKLNKDCRRIWTNEMGEKLSSFDQKFLKSR